MAVHKKFNALGRGLDALISTESVRTQGSSTINEIAIEQIEANPNQPRREFDEEALRELATSIREIGIIQPITLHQVADNKFQIIAGERRWRASQLAGLKSIPAYIRTVSDENVMEMALVENIQREDLNAIEIALAYEHLMEKSGRKKWIDSREDCSPGREESCRCYQLSTSAQTPCTSADGFTEERDRHGACPGFVSIVEPLASNTVV